MFTYSTACHVASRAYSLCGRFIFIWGVAVTLGACASLKKGPIGFWSRNRFDASKGQRHGPWCEYFDAAEQQIANKGRYRHGTPVGRWRSFSPSGQLERKEQFHWRPRGLATLTYYHPNGQVEKTGQARYQIEPTGARFFWFGEWRCFSPAGQTLPSEWYQDGEKIIAPLEMGNQGTTTKRRSNVD
ncbi:hypothetical protein DNI29_00145 [Hymenobacter sediminis]|uniref:toxin-antitoxin system YwqK family antitoxin n=1 Tax=Hymenobacter sediminis TaxID=2218621 RepID=UPI000DA687E1|nr:hypothetical protein [Hymenobacter sediminis]RPD49250.1 hypothetical protein DNI29_00145 [Hymenobacter sediminis]